MNVGLINRMTLFYAHEMRHACSFEVPGVAVLLRHRPIACWSGSDGTCSIFTIDTLILPTGSQHLNQIFLTRNYARSYI